MIRTTLIAKTFRLHQLMKPAKPTLKRGSTIQAPRNVKNMRTADAQHVDLKPKKSVRSVNVSKRLTNLFVPFS